MINKWLRIKVLTQPVLVESISDFLIGVLDAGVEVGIDENKELKTINVYFQKSDPTPSDITDIIAEVTAHVIQLADIFGVDHPHIDWQEIEEEDWGRTWKKYFVPFSVTEKFVIAPTWQEYEAQKDEIVLVMDPGMAFGTGHHATTSLALQMIEREMLRNDNEKSVLDVGTGTGILGMAAALLGAISVLGIDNDPVAVRTAMENIEKNNLSDRMQVEDTPVSKISNRYSLVIANIVHDVLADMVSDLHRLTEPHGTVVLSGILHGGQVESIRSIFEKQGFHYMDEKRKEEWAALLFCKP